MELFPFIKIIFTDPKEYSKITPGEKRKQYFMCNRRFAIQHPLEANALQHLKINQEAVIDWWQKFLRRKYKFVPGWMYTKGIKKSQEIKEKKLTVNNDTIREDCNFFKIDKKNVIDALEFYHDDMIKELTAFSKMINQK
jgi:hypothetical protein